MLRKKPQRTDAPGFPAGTGFRGHDGGMVGDRSRQHTFKAALAGRTAGPTRVAHKSRANICNLGWCVPLRGLGDSGSGVGPQ